MSIYRNLDFVISHRDTAKDVQLQNILEQIDEFFDSHPQVVEHSRPVCCEGFSKRWGIKIGIQFCFSSLRRYIKFFQSLFSLIRRIQGVEHSYDVIEVFSNSDPFDGDSWKMFRNNYIDVLFTNGQSFDFDPCELEPYEDPAKRRELRLNESILDDITDRTSVDVRDAQTDVNRDEYYEH